MSVQLEPSSQLSFRRPLTQVTKESLLVTNPNNDPVMFKVKTTAPKQYCVRPNAGRVEANSQVEVQVILQPFKEEPPADFKCRDKFLVQTAVIKPAYESLNVAEMWSRVEAEDKSGIFQQKIKCVFLPPAEEDPYLVNQSAVQDNVDKSVPAAVAAAAPAPAPPATQVPEVAKEDNRQPEPQTQQQPEPAVVTAPAPAPAPAAVNLPSPSEPAAVVREEMPELAPTTQVSQPVNGIVGEKPAASVPEPKPRSIPAAAAATTTTATPATPPPAAAAAPPAAAAPVSAAPTVNKKAVEDGTIKELQDELRRARELIEKLQQENAGLQKIQKEADSAAKSGRKLSPTVHPQDAVHQHLAALEKPRPTEGYPPQVVLIVASLVFVFTYLFF